ncbi:MAG: hypothetical protein SNJ84_05070 [Verrucomicrobiia bacterium]
MIRSAVLVALAAACWFSTPAVSAQQMETVDGLHLNLSDPAFSTVVIYSNQTVQRQTRAAGQMFDPLQGKPRFRLVVVVDLRGSLANWAPGYTIRRIKRDLDQEAVRLQPFFRANGNSGNPRDSLFVVADFTGSICTELGWPRPLKQEQILFFPRRGPRQLWKPPFNPEQLRTTIGASL